MIDDRVMFTRVPSDAMPFVEPHHREYGNQPGNNPRARAALHNVCRWLHCGTYTCIGCRQQQPASDPPRGLLASARLTNLWVYENLRFTQSWAPPLMGGEGKPVASHCTPEQKQIAACQKLRLSYWGCKPNVISATQKAHVQVRSFGWALRAGKSALQHGRRPHNNR